jgi:hypothetical protein
MWIYHFINYFYTWIHLLLIFFMSIIKTIEDLRLR